MRGTFSTDSIVQGLLTAAMLAGAAVAQTSVDSKPTPQQAPDTAGAKAAFEKRLAAIDDAIAKVSDLRAEFVQTKKTALLKKPLVSKGTLVCKGESVLWHTTQPRKSSMLVGPEKVTVYYPEDTLLEVYAVGARFRDAAGGPLPRLSRLRERFDITPLTEAELKELEPDAKELKGLLGVRLTPKDEALKKHVASVRVVLDEAAACAKRVVIEDPDGDVTAIEFLGVKTNTGVTESDLKLTIPEGTRVSTPLGEGK
jgi:outer membrane lipoprotein-sorting protein